jgi:hypothetical protein
LNFWEFSFLSSLHVLVTNHVRYMAGKDFLPF